MRIAGTSAFSMDGQCIAVFLSQCCLTLRWAMREWLLGHNPPNEEKKLADLCSHYDPTGAGGRQERNALFPFSLLLLITQILQPVQKGELLFSRTVLSSEEGKQHFDGFEVDITTCKYTMRKRSNCCTPMEATKPAPALCSSHWSSYQVNPSPSQSNRSTSMSHPAPQYCLQVCGMTPISGSFQL